LTESLTELGGLMKRGFLFLVIGLVAVSVFFKGLFFELEQSIFFVLISIAATGYFTTKLIKKERLIFNRWMVAAGGMLIFAVLLSFTRAAYPRGNITLLLQTIIYIIVAVIVTDYFSDNDKEGASFLILFASVGFIAAVIGLFGHTGVNVVDTFTDTSFGKRLNSTFQYANTAGIYFGLCFFLALTVIIKYKNFIIRAMFTGISSIILVAMFFTGSRGTYVVFPIAFIIYVIMVPAGFRLRSLGSLICVALPFALCLKGYNANALIANSVYAFKWLALCFGLSVMSAAAIDLIISPLYKRFIAPILLKHKVLRYFGAATVLVGVIVLIAVAASYIKAYIPADFIKRIATISIFEKSAVDRFGLDLDAWTLFKSNWLGYGGGGWTALYQSIQHKFITARSVHNNFFQVLVEAGIIGFLAYMAVTLTAFACFIYAYIKAIDNKRKLLVSGFMAAYAAVTLHSAIDFDLTFASMSLLWWSFTGISAAFANTASGERGGKSMFAGVSLTAPLYITLILSVGLVLPNAAFTTSALYADKAAEYRENADISNAIVYYEKASRIDGMNALNYSTLAELYNRMAANSEKKDDMSFWRTKALDAAQTSVKYNPNYPYYNYVLTTVYFDSGEPIKAYNQAEKLMSLQPLYPANNEVLAKGYIEAGLEYYRQGDATKAKELITKGSQINNDSKVTMTQALKLYKGKALLLRKKFTEAEVLIKAVRDASEKELEMKIECDRLLYIINQQTGKSGDNAKYKGVLWMGMVEKTPVYIEATKIIKAGDLE